MGQNEIQRGGLNSLLRRTLTIKGDLPPSSIVGAEIVPVLALEVDRPEWGYLNEERLGVAETNPPGAVGELALAVFEVPVGSNLLVTIEKVTVQQSIAAPAAQLQMTMYHPLVLVSDLLPNNRAEDATIARDWRYVVPNQGIPLARCACKIWRGSRGSVLGGGILLADMNVPVAAPATQCNFIDRIGPIVMIPGWKFQIAHFNTNTIMCVCVSFRERLLQPNELPTGLTGTL